MALHLLSRANDALRTNPPAGDNFLNVNGSNWLWAVTAVFTLTFLLVAVHTRFARQHERIFHYLFAIATLVGAIAYFAQASDLGWSLITQADSRDRGLTRQIFFAKYVFWTVAFPAVIVALGLLSGISWATILYQVFLAWTWVVSFLVSAYTATDYKWGFFAYGLAAQIALHVSTLTTGRRSARRVGVARDYTMLAGWANLLWFMYPIAYGLSDGGNRIGVVGGFIFFGILDLLLVPVMAAAFIVLARNWDYNKLNLAFTQYGRVARSEGTYPEKAHGAPAGGVAGDHAARGVV